MKCYGCGKNKKIEEQEIYPYEEDNITDTPTSPLFVIECEGKPWKVVVVCHECFHRLQPDMWISERCWVGIDPVVPFERLPEIATNKWDVNSYPELE